MKGHVANDDDADGDIADNSGNENSHVNDGNRYDDVQRQMLRASFSQQILLQAGFAAGIVASAE